MQQWWNHDQKLTNWTQHLICFLTLNLYQEFYQQIFLMLYIKKTIFRVLDNKRSICKLLLDHFHVKYEIMEVGAEGREFYFWGGGCKHLLSTSVGECCESRVGGGWRRRRCCYSRLPGKQYPRRVFYGSCCTTISFVPHLSPAAAALSPQKRAPPHSPLPWI